MADETLHHERVEFEREDLSAGGIFAFLIGLAIAGVLVHVILYGMFRYLDEHAKTHQPPQNPLIKATNGDTRVGTAEDANKFPQPRLETNERTEFTGELLKQEEVLNSYGWVDQKGGTAHIPVERAMELLAQRGLPTAPQNAVAAKKQNTKLPGGNTALHSGGDAAKSPGKPQ
jgi:hypothetical protein